MIDPEQVVERAKQLMPYEMSCDVYPGSALDTVLRAISTAMVEAVHTELGNLMTTPVLVNPAAVTVTSEEVARIAREQLPGMIVESENDVVTFTTKLVGHFEAGPVCLPYIEPADSNAALLRRAE